MNTISTNGSEISGTIRATYYKNGIRNIIKNLEEGLGYEGVIQPDYIIVAQRGRYTENGKTEQKLELGNSQYCNAITTVQKDGMIMENTNKRYRIRKLTPKECWRLMGIKDKDFDKAQEVNSSSQLYKEAGNGIVVPVLMAIFSQLGIKDCPKWNDLSDDLKNVLLNDI